MTSGFLSVQLYSGNRDEEKLPS